MPTDLYQRTRRIGPTLIGGRFGSINLAGHPKGGASAPRVETVPEFGNGDICSSIELENRRGLKPFHGLPCSAGCGERGGMRSSVDRRSCLSLNIQVQVIARGVAEVLLQAQVPLGSHDGRVAEGHLDLIQFGATLVCQFGVSSAQIVR